MKLNLKQALTLLQSLLSGWFNHFFNREQALYNERYPICKRCEKLGKDEIGEFCEVCGCSISPKVRSKYEQCPIDKW